MQTCCDLNQLPEPDYPKCLQNYRQDNETQAGVEGKFQIFIFVIDHKRKGNTVNRFQVVTEINSKRTYPFQSRHGEKKRKYSAQPAEDDQPEPVLICREGKWNARFVQIEWQDTTEKYQPPGEFIKAHGFWIIVFQHFFIEYGKYGSKQSRDESERNACFKSGVKMKYKVNTDN